MFIIFVKGLTKWKKKITQTNTTEATMSTRCVRMEYFRQEIPGESNDEHTICTLFCTNKKSELFQARFNVYLELFSNFSAWKSFHFFIKSSFLFFVSRFVQQSKHVFLVSFYSRLVKRLQRDKDCVKLFPTIRYTNQYLKTAKARHR